MPTLPFLSFASSPLRFARRHMERLAPARSTPVSRLSALFTMNLLRSWVAKPESCILLSAARQFSCSQVCRVQVRRLWPESLVSGCAKRERAFCLSPLTFSVPMPSASFKLSVSARAFRCGHPNRVTVLVIRFKWHVPVWIMRSLTASMLSLSIPRAVWVSIKR